MGANLAPTVLFVYSRPEHTRKTLEALAKNNLASESDLIIYSDAPKNDQAASLVEQVRDYIKTVKGFSSIKIVEREKNWGLANSVIDGVTNVINEYGAVIVLEDDMITSKFFLEYMNDGLRLYKNCAEVSSINAFIHLWADSTFPDTYFLPHSGCWGWGTWKRAWDNLEKKPERLLSELKKRHLCKKFDFNSAYPYTRMLKKQCEGKVDSWAIRWYATNFLLDLKGLYPKQSFVYNIGCDGSGVHCGEDNEAERLMGTLADAYQTMTQRAVKVDPVIYDAVVACYRRLFPTRYPFLRSVLNMLPHVLSDRILDLWEYIRSHGR